MDTASPGVHEACQSGAAFAPGASVAAFAALPSAGELGGMHLPLRSVLAGQPAGRAGHLWLRQPSALPNLAPVAVLVQPLGRLTVLVAGSFGSALIYTPKL
ncbi:hypothetical protein SASPL_114627 [Salvia splendens]|uniref:Uncharacterized protein n=1 Tax=Salvia splendens TaxID=180675 RepID=A0A8X9A0K1_SALSN|nr:hypothetical protein SASPL_114627 [Salvia splendens]